MERRKNVNKFILTLSRSIISTTKYTKITAFTKILGNTFKRPKVVDKPKYKLALCNVSMYRHTYYSTQKQARFFYYESLDYYLFNNTQSVVDTQKLGTKYVIGLHAHKSSTPIDDVMSHNGNDIATLEKVSRVGIENKLFTAIYLHTASWRFLAKLRSKNSENYLNSKLNLISRTVSRPYFTTKDIVALFHHSREYKHLKVNLLQKTNFRNSIFFKEILKNTSSVNSILHLDKKLINGHLNWDNIGKLVRKDISSWIKLNIIKTVIVECNEILKMLLSKFRRLLSNLKKHILNIKSYLGNAKEDYYSFERRLNSSTIRSSLFRKYLDMVFKIHQDEELVGSDDSIYGVDGIHAMDEIWYSAYDIALNKNVSIYAKFFNLKSEIDSSISKLLSYTASTNTYRLLLSITFSTISKNYLQLYQTQFSIKNNIEYFAPLFGNTAGNLYGYYAMNKFYYHLARKAQHLRKGYTNENTLLYNYILRSSNLLDYSGALYNAFYKNTFYYPISAHLQQLLESVTRTDNEGAISSAYVEPRLSVHPQTDSYEAIRNKFENLPTDVVLFTDPTERENAYKYISHGLFEKQIVNVLNNTNKLARLLSINTILSEDTITDSFISGNKLGHMYRSESKALSLVARYSQTNLYSIHKKLRLYRKKYKEHSQLSYSHNMTIYQLYTFITRKYEYSETNNSIGHVYEYMVHQLTYDFILPLYIYLCIQDRSINNVDHILTDIKKYIHVWMYFLHIHTLNKRKTNHYVLNRAKVLLKLVDILPPICQLLGMKQYINLKLNLSNLTTALASLGIHKHQQIQQQTSQMIQMAKYYTKNNLMRVTQINHKLNKIKYYNKNQQTMKKEIVHVKYDFDKNLISLYERTEVTTNLRRIAVSVFYLKSREQHNQYSNISKYNILSFRKFLLKNKYSISLNRWKIFRDVFYDLISNYRTIHLEPSDLWLGRADQDWQTISQFFADGKHPYPRNLQKATSNRNFITNAIDRILSTLLWVDMDNSVFWNSHLHHARGLDFEWLGPLFDLVEDEDEPDDESMDNMEDVSPDMETNPLAIDDPLPYMTGQYIDEDIASHKFLLWEIGNPSKGNLYEPSFFDSKLYYLDYIDYIYYKYYILEMPITKRILQESYEDKNFDLKDPKGKNKTKKKKKRGLENIDQGNEEPDTTLDEVFEQTLRGKMGLLDKYTWDVNTYDLDYKINNQNMSINDIIFGYYGEYLNDSSTFNIIKGRNIHSTVNNINKTIYAKYIMSDDEDTTPYQIAALRWMVANNATNVRTREKNKTRFIEIQNKIRSTDPITTTVSNDLLLRDYTHVSGGISSTFHLRRSKVLDKPGLSNLSIIPNYMQNATDNEIYLYRKFVSWVSELQNKGNRTESTYYVEKVRAIKNIVSLNLLTESHELLSYSALETNTKSVLYQVQLYQNNISHYNQIVIPLNLHLKNNTYTYLRNAANYEFEFNIDTQQLQLQKDIIKYDSATNEATDDIDLFAKWDRNLVQFDVNTIPPAPIFVIFNYIANLEYKKSNTRTITELISECNKRLLSLTYTGPYTDSTAMTSLKEEQHRNNTILKMYRSLVSLREQIIKALKLCRKKNLYINTRLNTFIKKYGEYTKYSYKILQDKIDKHILFCVPIAFILLYMADLPFVAKFYNFISSNLVKNINILSIPYVRMHKFNRYDQILYKQTIYNVYSKVYISENAPKTPYDYLFDSENTEHAYQKTYTKLHDLSIERRFIWYLLKKQIQPSNLNGSEILNLYKIHNLIFVKNKLTNNKLALLQLDKIIATPDLLMQRYHREAFASPIVYYQYTTPAQSLDTRIYTMLRPVTQGYRKLEPDYYQPVFFTLACDQNEQAINYLELNNLYRYNKYKHYLTYTATNNKTKMQYFVRFVLYNIDLSGKNKYIESTYGSFMAKIADIHKKNRKKYVDPQRYLFPQTVQPLMPKIQSTLSELYFWFPHYHTGILYYQNTHNIVDNKYFINLMQQRSNIDIERIPYLVQSHYLLYEGDYMRGVADYLEYDSEVFTMDEDPEPHMSIIDSGIAAEWSATDSKLMIPTLDYYTSYDDNTQLIRYFNTLYKSSKDTHTYKIKSYSKTLATASMYYLTNQHEIEVLVFTVLYGLIAYMLDTGSSSFLQYNEERAGNFSHTFFQYISDWPLLFFFDDASRQAVVFSSYVDSPREIFNYTSIAYKIFGDKEQPYLEDRRKSTRILMLTYPIEPFDFFQFEIDIHPILRMFTHAGYRIWNEQLSFMLLLHQNRFWSANYLADVLLFLKLFDQTKKILSDIYVNNIVDLKNEFKKYNLQEETIPAYLIKYHTVNSIKTFRTWLQTYAYGLYEYNRFVPENYAKLFSQSHIRKALYNNFVNPKEHSLVVRRGLNCWADEINPYQRHPHHRPEEFFTYPNRKIKPIDSFIAKRVLTKYSFSTNKSMFHFPRTGFEAHPYSYAMNMLYMHRNLLTLPVTLHKLYRLYHDHYEEYENVRNYLRKWYLSYLDLKEFFKTNFLGYNYLIKAGYPRRIRSRWPLMFYKKKIDKTDRLLFLQQKKTGMTLMRKHGFYPNMRIFFTSHTIKASDINLLYKPYSYANVANNVPIFTLHPSITNTYLLNNQHKYSSNHFVYPKQKTVRLFVVDNIYGPSTMLEPSKPLIGTILPFDIINERYLDLPSAVSANSGYSRYLYLSNAMYHARPYGPLWSIYHKPMIDSENALHTASLGNTQYMAKYGFMNTRNTISSAHDMAELLLKTVTRLDTHDLRSPIALPANPATYPGAAKYRAVAVNDEALTDGILLTLNPSSHYFPMMVPGVTAPNIRSARSYGRLTMRTLHSMYIPYSTHTLRDYTSYIPVKFDLSTKDILNSNYIRTYYWYHPSFYSTFVKRHPINMRIRTYQYTRIKNPFAAHYHCAYKNTPMYLQGDNVSFDDTDSNIGIASDTANNEDYLEALVYGIPFVEYVLPTQAKETKNQDTTIVGKIGEKLLPILEGDETDPFDGENPYNGINNRFRSYIYSLNDVAASFEGKYNIMNTYSMDFDPFQADVTNYSDIYYSSDDDIESRPVNIKKIFGRRFTVLYGYDKRPDIMYPLVRSYLPNKVYGQPAYYANNANIYQNRYKFVNIYEHFRVKPFAYITTMGSSDGTGMYYIDIVHKKAKKVTKYLARSVNKIIYPLESQWSAKRATDSLFLLDIRLLLSHHINTSLQKILYDKNKFDAKYGEMWIQKYGRYYPAFPPDTPYEWLTYGVRPNKRHAYQKYNLLFPHLYNRLIQLPYYRPTKSFFPTVVMWQYSNMLGFGETKNWIHRRIPKGAEFILHENFYTKKNYPRDLIMRILESKKGYIFIPTRYLPLEENSGLTNPRDLLEFVQKKMDEYKQAPEYYDLMYRIGKRLEGKIIAKKKRPKKIGIQVVPVVETVYVPDGASAKLRKLYPVLKKRKKILVRKGSLFPKEGDHKRKYINRTYFNGFLNGQKRRGKKIHRKFGEAFITIHKDGEIYKTYNLRRLVMHRLSYTGVPFQYKESIYTDHLLNNVDYTDMFLRMSRKQWTYYKYLMERTARIEDARLEARDYLCEAEGYTVEPKEKAIKPTTFFEDVDTISRTITYFRNLSKVDFTKGGRKSRNGARVSDLLVMAVKPRKYSKDAYSLRKLTQSLISSKQVKLIDTVYNTAYDRTRYWHIGSNKNYRLYKKRVRKRFSRTLLVDGILPIHISEYAAARTAKHLYTGSTYTIPLKDAYWIYMAPKLPKHQSNKFYTQELFTYKMDPSKPVDWSNFYNVEGTSLRGSFIEKQFIYNYRINSIKYNLPLAEYFYYVQYNNDKTYILNLHKFMVLTKSTPTIFEDYRDVQPAFVPDCKRTNSYLLKYNIQTSNGIPLENMELLNLINLLIQDVSIIGSNVKIDSYLYVNSFVRPMVHWGLKIYYNNIYYFDAFYSWTCDFIASIIIF